MSDRDDGGFFGFIEGILAVIGLLTVMGIAAVAVSVFAWEMELRRSEQLETTTPSEPPAAPSA